MNTTAAPGRLRTAFSRLLQGRFSHRAVPTGTATSSSLEFNVEFLENRKMLAGDVSATLTGGGDLVIRGDNLSNGIEIEPSATGVIVRGTDGTRVNGANARFFTGAIEDLQINLRNGNNVLQICGIEVTGDIVIRSGRGDDALLMRIVEVGDDVRIISRGGDDIVAIGSPTIGDDLKVITGSGDDALIMDGGDVSDDVLFITGSGNDSISFAEDLAIQDDAKVRTGSGNDFVGIGFDNVDVFGKSSAALGGGNDTLVLSSDTRFFGPSRAHGGGGRGDSIITHPDAFFSSDPRLHAFEGVAASTQTNALISNHFESIVDEFISRAGAILNC